jgi:hypothetical protein
VHTRAQRLAEQTGIRAGSSTSPVGARTTTTPVWESPPTDAAKGGNGSYGRPSPGGSLPAADLPPTVPALADTKPIPEVLSQAAEASKALLAQELQLAKAELSEKARSAGTGAGLLGAAGITALFALGALTTAGILALSLALPAWLAALLVGAFYGIVAGLIGMLGKGKVRQAAPLVPEQTIRTLGRLPAKLSRAWQRGQA